MKITLLTLAFLTAIFTDLANSLSASKPNIVFILCDDLGYGDIHCMAPETSKIKTPNADNLAKQGTIFTDAHSGSSVCTPTRYGLLTGRYSWRTRLQKGVVTGFAPSLIAKNRPTVASFLKAQGYHTACIGKWHLDFQYLDPDSKKAFTQKEHKLPPVGALIPDGPIHRGFDFYHGFHHARNMKAVIENDRVISHDDEINMLPRLTEQSATYIDSRADKKEQPFFLYVPLGSPHTPIVPSEKWQGKSALGKYGDFVMETDNVIGVISKALKRNGMTDNTLVIFTSDNGCSKAAGIPNLRNQGHHVSAHLRGSKADIWDGGHRVPFIARWPNNIKAGASNDELFCLVDFFATAADIVGSDSPSGSCEDSVSFLPALLGKTIPKSSRPGIIHHSFSGHFAYRMGKWKLVLARGSGGWSSPNERASTRAPEAQLYDMKDDPSEQNNLYLEKPDVAKRLLIQLKADVANGRSVKGPKSKNDIPLENINIWKSGRGEAAKAADDKPKNKKKKKTS